MTVRKPEGRFIVTAPGRQRSAFTLGGALALAQTLASVNPREKRELTVTVRELPSSEVIARVERNEDGTILTYSRPSR